MNLDIISFAKAIADTTRQQIMKELCCEWLSINDLAARIGVSQPTISHHCSVLTEAGLLDKRREGKQVFCSLNQERVTYCCGMLIQNFAPQEAEQLIGLSDIQAPAAS